MLLKWKRFIEYSIDKSNREQIKKEWELADMNVTVTFLVQIWKAMSPEHPNKSWPDPSAVCLSNSRRWMENQLHKSNVRSVIILFGFLY